MPFGRLLVCEPYGPREINGSQGGVAFLERGAPWGRSTVGVLCSSVQKLTKLACSPLCYARKLLLHQRPLLHWQAGALRVNSDNQAASL